MKHALAMFSAALCVAALPQTAGARDSLGIFQNWGAFRDPSVPRCYAIAVAEPTTLERQYRPFASIGTWPRRNIRGQLHVRLSRKIEPGAPVTLRIGGERFRLASGGGDAWARDARMDAAIIAAMRVAGRMIVGSRDVRGRRFSNTYDLSGAATAMDAATVACAQYR
ncbi:hypothetical protein [Pseudopontixanthobacter vadosimaris]|uniref:hypothetical protein n=1 Tax=Pseudopontixanthobacter vadosimaris TaxID=2726450 RepID=UPI0030B8D1FA